MNPLQQLIVERARQQNGMTVAEFMDMALQHPDHGYYRKGDRLGRSGDFITAPEISQMFGEMIGLWCAETWKNMGGPDNFALLELGAGRGTLMQDALRATAKIKGFHTAADVYLLESNESFRQMQKEKLVAHLPHHLDDLSHLPKLPAIIIANEFFDALPIRQFEKKANGWHESIIIECNGNLAFSFREADQQMLQVIATRFPDAPDDTVHEISIAGLGIMRDLSRHVADHGGAILAIDYGYTEPPGKDSLQGVGDHHYVPLLERPGEVDLTAHVDFQALRHVAEANGMKASGILGQGEFLKTLGIDLRASQLKLRATLEQAHEIDAALHRLTDVAEMGSLFKVLALSSPDLASLPGF